LRTLARDFLLIVTGVLTALGLENWNAGNKDDRLETEYLRALVVDTRSHMVDYEAQAERLQEHLDRTTRIWDWAHGATPKEPVDEVLLWVRLGGQLNLTTQFQNGAYQDLVNSGKLGIIRHRAVREALIDYHNFHARWNTLSAANGQGATDQYTDAVAGVIPADVAWRAAAADDLTVVDLAPILAEFRSRPYVRHALVGLAESHRFRANAASRGRERAASLLSVLEAELGSR
jgi:hypothetical protein